MLREVTLHADWCEMTMSMMREKQFEACERRLFAHPGVGLFAPEATEADAQALLAGSFDDVGGKSRHTLATLEGLRAAVMERLPKEALYISAGEMQLVERLLINDGELLLGDWDDLGAAEALVSRLWCSFHAEGDDWTLFDVSKSYRVDPEAFLSKGRATPFAGMELFGECLLTVVGGKIAWLNPAIASSF